MPRPASSWASRTLPHTINTGGLNDRGMYIPNGVAVDEAGRVFVADLGNNRVLVFSSSPGTHAAAHDVLGQHGSTITGGINRGGLGPDSMW